METRYQNRTEILTWSLVGFTILAAVQIQSASVDSELKLVSRSAQTLHVRELLGKRAFSKLQHDFRESSEETSDFIFFKVKSMVQGDDVRTELKIANSIIEESNRYGFDPFFIMAVIRHESRFQIDALGKFGEIGLMQLKPDTAAWIAERMNIKAELPIDLKNPVTNIKLGTAYLAYLKQELNHPRHYISAYNMGPGNVRKLLAKKIKPKIYASGVMERYQRLYSEMKTIYSQSISSELVAIQE